MAHIELTDLSKVYDDDVVAVDGINLAIEEGEFVTLVGPSGCGKTTTLRMIAGFETPTEGHVSMGGADITDLPPFHRDVGMVFQSFALFPHLTVEENVAYGMRVSDADYSEDEIDERVDEMLSLIELPEIGPRKPDQLSGGQQQRVALARALALNPGALLLDEPLASLDERLRKQMQAELSRIQKELGVTTVFVTHNQEEAMTMSDRIVVMNDGQFEQIGSPDAVYNNPDSVFVADFIGKANIFRGPVTARENGIVTVDTADTVVRARDEGDSWSEGARAGVVVRPEDITLSNPDHDSNPADGGATTENSMNGEITLIQMLGGTVEYRVRTGDAHELLVTAQSARHREQEFGRGEHVRLSFPTDTPRLLHRESIVSGAEPTAHRRGESE